MKKPVLAIRNLGKRIGGGVMGSLMLFSGTVMPYQGIIQPKPLTGFAVEAADSAAYIPYAEETKPVTTTVSQTVTTAASTTSVSKATAVGSTAAASATQTSATAKPSTTTKAAVTTKPAATTKVTATTKPAATTTQTAAAVGFDFTVDQSAAVLEKYTGTASEITIPATYQGVPVTEISSDAFSQNKQLKSAELPASIRVIGSSAFSNCTALEKITLQEGLETIGSNAFSNTALTEINIPASLQKADQPFYGCKSLEYAEFKAWSMFRKEYLKTLLH
ncbi:MAG: leucine-rich repeat domain-containing protein [Oscillospiraceae bacterium]|nr:leucine-rich repeat domain-containing protein [Oscillospiraceae bacterium]